MMQDTPNLNLHGSADIDEDKVEQELIEKNIVWYVWHDLVSFPSNLYFP